MTSKFFLLKFSFGPVLYIPNTISARLPLGVTAVKQLMLVGKDASAAHASAY